MHPVGLAIPNSMEDSVRMTPTPTDLQRLNRSALLRWPPSIVAVSSSDSVDGLAFLVRAPPVARGAVRDAALVAAVGTIRLLDGFVQPHPHVAMRTLGYRHTRSPLVSGRPDPEVTIGPRPHRRHHDHQPLHAGCASNHSIGLKTERRPRCRWWLHAPRRLRDRSQRIAPHFPRLSSPGSLWW